MGIAEQLVPLALQGTVTGIIAYFLLDLKLNDTVAVAAIAIAGFVIARFVLNMLASKHPMSATARVPSQRTGYGRTYDSPQHDMTQ